MKRVFKLAIAICWFIIYLSAALTAENIIKKDGLELRIKLMEKDVSGVIDFEVTGKNTTGINKTLTGTILVYEKGSTRKIGDAVVYLEFPKNKTAEEICHAFVDEDSQVGNWELAIDAIYDFTLEDLNSNLSKEDHSGESGDLSSLIGGLEDLNSMAFGMFDDLAALDPDSMPFNIAGRWQYSGDPRWTWIFKVDSTLEIIQKENDRKLLVPDVKGAFAIRDGNILINYEDLCEWPDTLEIRSNTLVAGEYILNKLE